MLGKYHLVSEACLGQLCLPLPRSLNIFFPSVVGWKVDRHREWICFTGDVMTFSGARTSPRSVELYAAPGCGAQLPSLCRRGGSPHTHFQDWPCGQRPVNAQWSEPSEPGKNENPFLLAWSFLPLLGLLEKKSVIHVNLCIVTY